MASTISRIRLGLSVSAVLFTASPVWAGVGGNGSIGVRYERFENSAGAGEQDGDVVHLDGAYVIPLGDKIGLQLNGSLSRVRTEASPQDSDAAAVSANLFYRAEHFSIGAFAGAGKLWLQGAPNDRQYGGGIEVNAYFGPVSVGAAYGMIDSQGAYGTSADGFDLAARVFPTDRVQLEAKYSLADVDFGPFDFGINQWRLSAEYQPPHWPVSLQAGVARLDSDSLGFSVDRVSIGIAYHFGTESPRERLRRGASLTTFSRFLLLQ